MIDRQALKNVARLNMSGKKPSAYFVSAVYIAIFGIITIFIYSLTGYNKYVEYIERLLPVNPSPTYEELAAGIPVIAPMAFFLILLLLLARAAVDVGYMGYCLKIMRREQAETRVIFDGLALIGKVTLLILLQAFFIFLWSLLFIIPGIIAYYKYRQAFYILLDNPKASPLDCIRRSTQMMKGFKSELFHLDLSFIGWLFLDLAVKISVILPLFSIWLAPYTGLARAGFYLLLPGNDSNQQVNT